MITCSVCVSHMIAHWLLLMKKGQFSSHPLSVVSCMRICVEVLKCDVGLFAFMGLSL